MATFAVLLDLAGAVALLLWGVRMVQTGIERAFGPDLRRFLRGALRRRLAGFAAGIGITAVLQSSTATGLMVSGFAAAGAIGTALPARRRRAIRRRCRRASARPWRANCGLPRR